MFAAIPSRLAVSPTGREVGPNGRDYFFVGALATLICAGLQRFSRGIGADHPGRDGPDDGLA
jgi:hypothetical protein